MFELLYHPEAAQEVKALPDVLRFCRINRAESANVVLPIF